MATSTFTQLLSSAVQLEMNLHQDSATQSKTVLILQLVGIRSNASLGIFSAKHSLFRSLTRRRVANACLLPSMLAERDFFLPTRS